MISDGTVQDSAIERGDIHGRFPSGAMEPFLDRVHDAVGIDKKKKTLFECSLQNHTTRLEL